MTTFMAIKHQIEAAYMNLLDIKLLSMINAHGGYLRLNGIPFIEIDQETQREEFTEMDDSQYAMALNFIANAMIIDLHATELSNTSYNILNKNKTRYLYSLRAEFMNKGDKS